MKKTLLFLSLYLFSQAVFAEVTCPSLNTIKGIKFTNARKIPWVTGPDNAGLWMATSDTFTDQGQNWSLFYTVTAKAETEEAVIQIAATKFRQKQMISPVKKIENNKNVCVYTSDNDKETVSAFNPPLESIAKKPQLPPQPNQNLNQGPVSDLQGNWYHDQAQTSIKMVQPTYTFCNEMSNCANGFWDNGIIQVPFWNVTGKLSHDGKTIDWSNGTRWQKK